MYVCFPKQMKYAPRSVFLMQHPWLSEDREAVGVVCFGGIEAMDD